MATTTRQTNMLVAEDWKKLYQTFREADFQSYDFQTLRKSMIDYLRIYYPEDFNDFIESSEFLALIDLIAFLGQSLSFRSDLNARENFIDTAERRDSILRLARLINYVPKRNIPASGYLKVDSISTTEVIYDSNGINLSRRSVGWNDSGNANWMEQFVSIINASLVSSQAVGKPSNSQSINDIQYDEYQVNLPSTVVPIFKFNNSIEDVSSRFELVSPSSKNEYNIYEEEPRTNKLFNLLYKNDNFGNGSNNTGFFLFFKQGELRSQDLNIGESLPNRVIDIDEANINNNDIWLYSLDSNGNLDTLWTQVPSVSGTNVIYNKSSSEKNLYQVNSREDDKISLVFGDGSFSNIPQGSFRVYFRVSNGLTYRITPNELRGVSIPIPYTSRSNKEEVLTIRASLYYTVANAVASETVDDIKQKAPQQYYTQNRMITGEDYNTFPYASFSSILKTKAVNRTSSGISRYLDVIDTTGKYSSTNIFGQDGYLYRENFADKLKLQFLTTNDIYKFVYNSVRPIISRKETQHFYYAFFNRYALSGAYPTTNSIITWNRSTTIPNGSTGYFSNTNGIVSLDHDYYSYITIGSILVVSAGAGNYFDSQNRIQAGVPVYEGDKTYLYVTVTDLVELGNGTLDSGEGTITLNQYVPTGAEVISIIPRFSNSFPDSLMQSMITSIQNNRNFGLRYNVTGQSWDMILTENLADITTDFSQTYEGNTTGMKLDSSWIIRFDATPGADNSYEVTYRGLKYIFESLLETKFYFDDKIKVFDPKTGDTIKDQIKVLKINTLPDALTPLSLDYSWHIYQNIVESDGYENASKILVTFADENDDGVPDNPDLFDIIVNPTVTPTRKLVFFQESTGDGSFLTYTPIDNALVITDYLTLDDIKAHCLMYDVGQLFYALTDEKFYTLANQTSQTFTENTDYLAREGRQNIYFQYRHNSPNYRRIDPSPSNIIDLFILSKSYEADYRSWIQDSTNSLTEPQLPTSEDLRLEYTTLESYKSVSDSIVYNPAKFKPIFGNKAPEALQATFKVVKNMNVNVSDNEIKSNVIDAINKYFAVENWDFGESFYFSELAAYLHTTLAPNIVSVIIVPANNVGVTSQFGSLFQINAEPDEIIISSATVDNVEIISEITAAQLR